MAKALFIVISRYLLPETSVGGVAFSVCKFRVCHLFPCCVLKSLYVARSIYYGIKLWQPENLLISADGHLKICDFGSAKMVRPLPNGFFQIEGELTVRMSC